MSAMPLAMPFSPNLTVLPAPIAALTSLRPGDEGLVVGLDGGETDSVAKLLALGVVPGVRVALESVGPAVVFRLGHARFAVDQVLAGAILVQIDQANPPVQPVQMDER